MNRKPIFAGRFYPSNEKELRQDLDNLFSKAKPQKDDAIAIISPHAGYMFSGEVAASSFNQVNKNRQYKNVFVLTSSHSAHFPGASIYNSGDYETPLGTIKVNKELANILINNHDVFNNNADAHSREHSLEVQLPFLQFHLNYDFELVPIVIGQDAESPRKIATALKEYFIEDNLFVISSDFSHYPEYNDAKQIDKITANAICKNNPSEFINTLRSNKLAGIDNLATDICGASAVLSLLYLTEGKQYNYEIIDYQNSGDSVYGDKNSVVGYYSIAVFRDNNKSEFNLTKTEKEELLKIARNSIYKDISENKKPEINAEKYSGSLKNKCGVFVTLKKNGNLRGCLGTFKSSSILPQTVAELAISSAKNDYRFSPVTIDELDDIIIEISVLSPMKKITSIDEIVLGKHGIYIKKTGKSGTFLPDVAVDMNWDLEQFLGHCARDKAGLSWDGWKDADIYVYETIKFSE